MSNLAVISFYSTGAVALAKEHLPFVEKCLDFAGYVPIVSTISGGIRINYGIAEIVAGLAFAIFNAVLFLYSQDEKFRRDCIQSLDFVIHGVVNVARGHIECLRWVNLVCLIHDVFVRAERDNLRLRYDKPIITIG
jgi:hypothetical protein